MIVEKQGPFEYLITPVEIKLVNPGIRMDVLRVWRVANVFLPETRVAESAFSRLRTFSRPEFPAVRSWAVSRKDP
ncbi:MAG: hypothetical protein WB696_02240, partial [Chthoniobacterales bacterium]